MGCRKVVECNNEEPKDELGFEVASRVLPRTEALVVADALTGYEGFTTSPRDRLDGPACINP